MEEESDAGFSTVSFFSVFTGEQLPRCSFVDFSLSFPLPPSIVAGRRLGETRPIALLGETSVEENDDKLRRRDVDTRRVALFTPSLVPLESGNGTDGGRGLPPSTPEVESMADFRRRPSGRMGGTGGRCFCSTTDLTGGGPPCDTSAVSVVVVAGGWEGNLGEREAVLLVNEEEGVEKEVDTLPRDAP